MTQEDSGPGAHQGPRPVRSGRAGPGGPGSGRGEPGEPVWSQPRPDIDAFLAGIGVWPDDERASDSATARSRRRWLSQQLAESATLSGLLLTLGELRAFVTVRVAGRALTGTIAGVTNHLCVMDLDRPPGTLALVKVAAVTSVEAGPTSITDDRAVPVEIDLAAVLASLVAERPPVILWLTDGAAVSGRLTNVGLDVISVRQNESGSTLHAPVAAIAACLLT